MKGLRKRLPWDADKPVLGIMAFDASRLMFKVVQMWHCLSDKQMLKVREYVANSTGIKKLVSDNEDYLMNLALAEIIDTFANVAKSVALLGKKCVDPIYRNLDGIFEDQSPEPKWHEWRYGFKKMEKRVRKMSRFVAATERLYRELEALSEQERRLRQLKATAKNLGKAKLFEFRQKVELQQQIVKDFHEISPWAREYDYVARLLLRSLSTIMERIRHVDGASPSPSPAGLMRGSNFSVSLGRSLSNLGSGFDRSKSKHSPSSQFNRKLQNRVKVRQFPTVSFNGCVTGGIGSPIVDRSLRGASSRYFGEIKDLVVSNPAMNGSFLDSKRRLLTAPSSTLGDAALALHYANLVLLIEKFAASPHSIDPEEREDLYDMLTTNVRRGFRAEVKGFCGGNREEWGSGVAGTLEWLSPLARDTVRWQSERGFYERQRSSPGSTVLLVQTLYFADRVETEAAVVRLLIGLNCLVGFRGSECDRTCCEGFNSPVIRRRT